jgi:hypothetical protein
MAGKLLLFPAPARPKGAGRARLLRACAASQLTQDELGALVGTTARGVRRLLRCNRKRADRLDLLCAIEAVTAGKNAA